MNDDRLIIRPMTAGDLDSAKRIFRLAFGTFFRVPDPGNYRADVDLIATRWQSDPDTAFVAESAGRIIGSIIGIEWGSQFILGPLTVDPAFWGRGIAHQLVAHMMDLVVLRDARLAALFTMPQSATHLRLYESFGFAPMSLTPIMTKPMGKGASTNSGRRFSALAADERPAILAQCRAVSSAVYDGLDLGREIAAITAWGLGDTVLIEEEGKVSGFALCHLGAGTEAGEGNLFVKFASVRPEEAEMFERLLDAVEALAAERGVQRIIAGVNTARRDAYRRMLARGFRAGQIGLAMHRPDEPGTLRPDVYVIDDWR
jgi:predicted N-acetyltransferase YhbS